MLMRLVRFPMQVPHAVGAQPRTPATPAQPRSSANSPMLWMQPGGGGGGDHQPFLQQPTPFQAMQSMQLDGGLLAQQRAMIRQQLQSQQVRSVLPGCPSSQNPAAIRITCEASFGDEPTSGDIPGISWRLHFLLIAAKGSVPQRKPARDG